MSETKTGCGSDSRTIKLRATGQAYSPEAVQIVRLSQEVVSNARKVAKGEAENLFIGFTAALEYEVSGELLSKS